MALVFRLGIEGRAGCRPDLTVGQDVLARAAAPWTGGCRSPASPVECDLRGIRRRRCRLSPQAGTQFPRGRDGSYGRGGREGPGHGGLGDGPQGGGRLAISEHGGRSGEVLKGGQR